MHFKVNNNETKKILRKQAFAIQTTFKVNHAQTFRKSRPHIFRRTAPYTKLILCVENTNLTNAKYGTSFISNSTPKIPIKGISQFFNEATVIFS